MISTQHIPILRSSIVRWATIVSALAILEAALLAQVLKTSPPAMIETTWTAPAIQGAPTNVVAPTAAAPVESASNTTFAATPPIEISGARITLRGRPAIHVSLDFATAAAEPKIEQLAQIASAQHIQEVYLVGQPETQMIRDSFRHRLVQGGLAKPHQIHLQKMSGDFSHLSGIVWVIR